MSKKNILWLQEAKQRTLFNAKRLTVRKLTVNLIDIE